MDSFGSQALHRATFMSDKTSRQMEHDPELEYRVKKVTDKFSECMQIIANEPSLALFRIQEHIRRSLPKLAECKIELSQTQLLVQGAYYDLDYAIRAVSDLQTSNESFNSIEMMMKECIIRKKKLNLAAQAARMNKVSKESPPPAHPSDDRDEPADVDSPKTT